jgi:hypothetical protein
MAIFMSHLKSEFATIDTPFDKERVRRQDMKKMILATRGKVFTAKTLDRLIESTQLKNFRTK